MIGYLDCASGVSGDTFLGALVDVGLDPARVEEACAAVGLEIALETERVTRAGIAGVAVTVDSDDTSWRTWATIRPRLEGADLPGRVREGALAAFALLADAEARVHGIAPDDVHFHEIGAADTVADLLGVALGLELLGVERLVCSPLALGSGEVVTAHGRLSVPAPATLELLVGVPAYGGPVEAELTTPTGAALVRAHAQAFGAMPPMTPQRTGRGAGSRDLGDRPNVVTLTLGEPETAAAPHPASEPALEPVVQLTTAIDHISPEHAAHAAERLREAGALDVWIRPLTMKKGRLGMELELLCPPAEETRFAALVVTETGSLGVRVHRLERYVAVRTTETVTTSHGDVRVKRTGSGVRPEHDEVARLAERHGVTYAEMLDRLAEEL